MQQQLSDTLRTDDGRPLSPIHPGTPLSQDENKNKSMRQLRNVTEDLQAKKNREKEERLQRSIQATLKKLGQKVDKSVMLSESKQSTKLQKTEFEEDRDRSPGTSPRRQRPARPNKFWKNNTQKVAKMEPPQMPLTGPIGHADEPQATKFPDIEDFLNKSPEEPSQLSISEGRRTSSPQNDLDKKSRSERPQKKKSPSARKSPSRKKSPPKSTPLDDFQKQFEQNFNQKPKTDEDMTNPDMTHRWNEEDNNRSEVILMPLNEANEDSMEFDDGIEDDKTDKDVKQGKPTAAQADDIQGLTISMENLLGGNKKPPLGRKVVPGDDRDTMKAPEHALFRRPSRGSRRGRDSKKPHDIQSNDQYPDALFEFFKSLDYNPNNVNQGTVRASYRSGRASYNLYGVPAKKPGEKSQVFVQSQEGFDRDMPPIRLSGEQTAQLVTQFKELDALDSQRQTLDEEAPDEGFLDQSNLNQKQKDGSPKIDFSTLENKQNKFEHKVPTPSKDKHVRAAHDEVQRNNKTFWSSGYERSIPNQPKVSQIQKKGMPGRSPMSTASKPSNFMNEFEKTMAIQSIPSEQTKDMNTSADDNNTSRGGISLKNIVYNVGSSVFGGFGGYSQSSKEKELPDPYVQHMPQTKASEPKNRSNIDQKPQNQMMMDETQRSKTPGGTRQISPSRRPQYSRFQGQTPTGAQSDHQPPAQPPRPQESRSSPKRIVYSPPHERAKAANQQAPNNSLAMTHGYRQPQTQDPSLDHSAFEQILADAQGAGPRKQPDLKEQFESLSIGNPDSYFSPNQYKPDQQFKEYNRPNDPAAEASVKSAKSYRSPSQRSKDSESRSRVSPSRGQRDPVVFKLTPNDLNKTPPDPYNGQYQQPYKGNPYDYKPPQVNKNALMDQPKEKPTPMPRSVVEDYREKDPYKYDRKRIDSNYQQVQSSEPDPNLPNVILLVADNVKLIRNNSVPLLQVQVEIIQNALSIDNDMCMLGLNDVIYIVPEFNPSDYDMIYPRLCTGNEFEEFGPFFEHYKNYAYNPSPLVDNIPERMMGLHKNSMTAIERDHYEPDLRGKAYINLKHVPNGHYTIFHLRIGQPISINSRLKVLGRAKGIFVNINREKISLCKKPQLDLNHSSSRISKRETSKFKIMKAKNNKKRDNKVMLLNSDDEEEADAEEEQQTEQEKKVAEDLKKMFNSTGEVNEKSTDDKDTGLEMEFDDNEKDKNDESKKQTVKPPPLQNSKDYYNSTQRMTDAMIQNPQFQLFSIDEEESMRSSMRESEDDRKKDKGDENKKKNNADLDLTPHPGTPPNDAPEDAFRNIHRQYDYPESSKSYNNHQNALQDPISKQIEDYQKESLAQLANLQQIQQLYGKPQPVNEPRKHMESTPKERPMPANEYVPPQQRRSSVHSRGSARSRNSMRSDGSGRKSTRIKTINLRELVEEDDNKGQMPMHQGRTKTHATPAPQRQRSRSLTHHDQEQERDTLQHPQYTTRKRSPSQGPLSPGRQQPKPQMPQQQQADDPYRPSLRETTKLDIINLNQQRPLNHPSMQRQQDMVIHYGRKEDRQMQPNMYSPQHQDPSRMYQPPNKGYPPERSRSPMNMNGGPNFKPQGQYPPPTRFAAQPEAPQRAMPKGTGGSRPWKRDRSRGGRSDSRASNDSRSPAQFRRMQPDLNKENQMGRASPARGPLRYDRFGNPINPHDQSYGQDRPKSAVDDAMNASMRSQNSGRGRPGSASKLQNSFDQSRNRFFSPQANRRTSKSRSQDRVSGQRQFQGAPTPSQLLNPAMMPQHQNMQRKPSMASEENFSDENHSPVRPMAQLNPLQSGALRQQHQAGGMRHRFGNSITGSVTNAAGGGGGPGMNPMSPGPGMMANNYMNHGPSGPGSRNFRSPTNRVQPNNSWNMAGRR